MKTLKIETRCAGSNVRRLLTISVVLLFHASASAQNGKAPPGSYPPGFNGHSFKGVVQSVDESQHHFTLTYTVGFSSETFVGALEKGYTTRFPDGTSHLLKVSDLPIGKTLTVYYLGEAKGTRGTKAHKAFMIEEYPNLNVGNTAFRSF